ncbi:MAG: BrnT family toxin [Nitrospira sp.]|nr:BrnT family toxin [Nitrospira sp.]
MMTVRASGFDWDNGNRAKCEKHGLSVATIEGLFARPLAVLPDAAHSQREKRFRAIGHTDKGRGVFIVFTFRKKGDDVLIRPISVRYMHTKEVDAYEKENPNL